MSLLTMIIGVCDQIGLPRPSSVISSLDQQIRQLIALANREGQELATGDSVSRSFHWTALQVDATFITTGVENQGLITNLMPGFRRLIKNTMWNRSLREMIPVITPQDWQQIKAGQINTAYPYFRFFGTQLLFTPNATAGQTIAVEYHSRNWCQQVVGGDPGQSYSQWTNDSDVGLLPEDIMAQGIVWRWKQAKNFDYAEDFRTYQTIVLNAMANDGDSPVINISDGYEPAPGIAIPSGTWAL
jgi:hypothetical protein